MTDYVRPSYPELKARIDTDLAAMPSVLRGPLSAAWGRACHSQHGFLEWIDKQCSPLTCELERLYDWAALYGVDRLAATPATGTVLAIGTPGTALLADTVIRGLNGLDYTVLAAVTLGAGTTSVLVRCLTPGSAGNLLSAQTLTLVDPVPGVASLLTVDSNGLTGGDEQESLEDWRVRVADEWRVMVMRGGRSGKAEDYRYWAKSAHPSVSGALVQPHVLGMGSVIVRPICNALSDRLPTLAVLNAVSAYLDGIAPATADWRVTSPLVERVNVMIDLLPGFDSQTNRDAIDAALSALVLSESSETAVLTMAEIDAAIASVTQQYTRLAPLADLAVGPGELFVLNPVLWA
ncbi:MAG: baseplate J/gp47 family protein [Methylicorpusculum sp.]|uniref:baseplate J/gp47 family protein n=1 Tax=Methylicorpusculum sp. TaxID=2713644 RepID=UPI0027182BC1|nr:baseplate J/gp47 family protein [Methylicorpusculum sp.]MDO8941482.1 baseplate J/gp47 family protein [Methylicorpusculum sp.]MDP2202262.1 baseplate J/gp47 family protein [Methylicorpusculum sp.]